ncbi:GPI mannosyltransferase 3-like [Haliotis asinina]|uniref:GPI mannosyltransferase 3-like n=1 Tax=Haliotis asinina TaxID=109174 RepID=UPI003531C71B
MTKSNKSAATIRRRKLRPKQDDLQSLRESNQSSPIQSEDEGREEDDCHMFDDEVLGPNIIKKIMASERTLFLGLLALRITNSLLIQTFFVPDEYWQSLEVAHNMAFHYGHLTWEWQEGIRGYTYPLSFALLYKFLHIFGLDNRVLLIKLPRMLQGVMAACGDLYLYRLSRLLCDRPTAQWTLLCQTLSWFTLYCSTRTLTNSTEAVLVTMALYYYPWPKSPQTSSLSKFLVLAALSVIVRPTAAILWVLLCCWHLQLNRASMPMLIKQYIQIGLVVLGLATMIDHMFYDRWIFVQLRFLQFNVLKGGSAFYGSHPWHWYLTQGYPVVMATHIVPFILGAWKAKNKVLLFVILWTVFIYSFLSHKEFRFLLPILPISMHYCGVYFQSLCKRPNLKKRKSKKTKHEGDEDLNESFNSSISMSDTTDNQSLLQPEKQPSPSKLADLDPEVKRVQQHRANLSKAKVIVLILLVTNIPMALYFCLIHQRGTVDVMKFIHDASIEKNVDVLFLMPCHSTPYYSYVHRNISMRFLTCEPNLQQLDNYTDEAEVFFHDPVRWLKTEYSGTRLSWPSHIIYFSPLQGTVGSLLNQNGYKQCARYFHTHLPEGRVGSHVLVSCR